MEKQNETALLMYGLISRALHVRQLLLHFLISGVALGPGRGSQRRFRSLSILCTIFESFNLAQVRCFLMLLWVLKATVGLFGKSLESSGDFSRCQCLTSSFLRRYVGMCGVSRNVISSFENSAVKLMRGCRALMLLMNCSRLSFVSVQTKNISSMYIF